MLSRRRAYIMKGEIFSVIHALLKNKHGFKGYITKWEETFASYIGVKHAVAVGSGRLGMELILKALNLNQGEEVIIPAYTLKDLIPVISSTGLKAVCADINPYTFNIDPCSILEKITERTRVILATHLFGTPCQIDKIMEIADKRSIFVIEDCAHAHGAEFAGRRTGSFGHAAFFSFETIKPINTYGGGIVVTNDTKLVYRIRQAVASLSGSSKIPLKKIATALLERCFFSTPFFFPVLSGLSSSRWKKIITSFYRSLQSVPNPKCFFSDFQAFWGMKKLETLDERNRQRRRQAGLLKEGLSRDIIPQEIGSNMRPNYYFFVGRVSSSAVNFRRLLLKQGIDAGIREEIADDCAAVLGQTDCPNANKVFQQAIQLPLHEGISEDNLRKICGILKNRAID